MPAEDYIHLPSQIKRRIRGPVPAQGMNSFGYTECGVEVNVNQLAGSRCAATCRDCWTVDKAAGVNEVLARLAFSEPPTDGEHGECQLCDADPESGSFQAVQPDDHYPRCPWRLAQEWRRVFCATSDLAGTEPLNH